MPIGRPDPNYDRYRADRSGHNIPATGHTPESRPLIHPLEFGRKAVSIGPAPLPAICAPDTCRLGSCDLSRDHSCRLSVKTDKTEPDWPTPPNT